MVKSSFVRPAPRWEIPPDRPELVRALSGELRISRLLARLLVNRGLESAEEAEKFLRPSLHDLHDPHTMKDMPQAAARVQQAVQQQQRVTIYADYDVDGVTSASVLYHFFQLLGLDVRTYVPERGKEGYGLNVAAIEKIAHGGCDLLITVDCGIRGVEPVAFARECGIDVIVTDHHEPGPELPPALAVINPKQAGCQYPFKQLCGAGVAFKLAWAVAQQLSGSEKRKVEPRFRSYLKQALGLAAIGTIADIVPLVGENRIISWWGLRCLPNAPWVGLRCLIDAIDLRGKAVAAEHVSFRIGPRLNAAGRMGSARRALELLTTDDARVGARLAEELGRENRQRQQVERAIADEAAEQVVELGLLDEKVLVLASDQWHPGVVGIVASRMVERFGRPAVLIALDGDRGRGSVRSVPGFVVLDALQQCSDHLVRVGGHAMAAGLEIEAGAVDPFRQALQSVCRDTLDDALLVPSLRVDVEAGFREIDGRLIDELSWLEPTGCANPSAVLGTRGVEIRSLPRQMGADGRHMSFWGRHDDRPFRVIGWRRGDRALEFSPGDRVDIAYRPVPSTYQGDHRIELHLDDIQRSAAGAE